jgi:hypothetical protein
LELDHSRLSRELEQLLEHLQGHGGALADWAFAESLVQPFRDGERLDRMGLAELLDLLGLYFRDQAVAAAGRPGLALLPDGGGQKPPGLGRSLRCFGLLRQAQSAILANAPPELVLVVLLGRLRDPRVANG